MTERQDRFLAGLGPKLPPCDSDLEQLVLSAWITDSNFRQAWKPEPELFFLRPHVEIATVFEAAYPAERWNEAFTVAELTKSGKLQAVGSRDEVYHILAAPSLANPFADVERLRELHTLRQLLLQVGRVGIEIKAGARLHEAQALLQEAVESSVTGAGVPVLTARDLMDDVVEHVSSDAPIEYCTTGIQALDDATGGIQRKKVWVLAATTGWGKSSWAVMIVDENLKHGIRVLVVTVEDDREVWAFRIACRRARVNFDRFLRRQLKPYEVSEVMRHANELAECENLYFIDATEGVSVERLGGQIRALCVAHKIHLALVDYAQAAISEGDRKRNDEVRHIGRTFTNAIKGGGAGGAIFSQVTKDATGRVTGDSIRDSKDLAMAAEGVLVGQKDKGGGKSIKVWKMKLARGGDVVDAIWDPISACFNSDISQLQLSYCADPGDDDEVEDYIP